MVGSTRREKEQRRIAKEAVAIVTAYNCCSFLLSISISRRGPVGWRGEADYFQGIL